MKKEIKFLIGLLLIVVVLLLSFYFASKPTKTNEGALRTEVTNPLGGEDDMTYYGIISEEEKASMNLHPGGVYQILARDEAGAVTAYKVLELSEDLKIKLDWMTDEEKIIKNVDPSGRYQVLERDDNGNILAYKVVREDNDIVTKY